jgi:hypothetical protein
MTEVETVKNFALGKPPRQARNSQQGDEVMAFCTELQQSLDYI